MQGRDENGQYVVRYESLDELYADSERFCKQYGDKASPYYSMQPNRELIDVAVGMALIDINSTNILPPVGETPSFLRLVRIYLRGYLPDLKWSDGVQIAKLEREGWTVHEIDIAALEESLYQKWADDTLPPPDYYTDAHAEICRCELCQERAMQNPMATHTVTGRYDPALDESAT